MDAITFRPEEKLTKQFLPREKYTVDVVIAKNHTIQETEQWRRTHLYTNAHAHHSNFRVSENTVMSHDIALDSFMLLLVVLSPILLTCYHYQYSCLYLFQILIFNTSKQNQIKQNLNKNEKKIINVLVCLFYY